MGTMIFFDGKKLLIVSVDREFNQRVRENSNPVRGVLLRRKIRERVRGKMEPVTVCLIGGVKILISVTFLLRLCLPWRCPHVTPYVWDVSVDHQVGPAVKKGKEVVSVSRRFRLIGMGEVTDNLGVSSRTEVRVTVFRNNGGRTDVRVGNRR